MDPGARYVERSRVSALELTVMTTAELENDRNGGQPGEERSARCRERPGAPLRSNRGAHDKRRDLRE